MSAPGDIVFHRGENEAEDANIWDDTALIKAYDNAISIMKEELSNRNGIDSNINTTPKPQQHKQKGKSKGKRKSKKKDKNSFESQPALWKEGDRCRAVFSEDGCVYDATVVCVDKSTETCWVKYVGYGNKEQQLLKDLLPTAGYAEDSDALSETDSVEHSGRHSNSHRQSPSMQSQSGPGPHPQGWGGFPTGPAGPMPQCFPMMPPMFPGWMPPGPSVPANPRLPSFPPPPPMVDEDAVANDKEALYSMLMSWYMSGYHTGYYQGLKEGKKHASGSKEQTRHRNTSSDAR